jgi:hypothetical protein
LTACLCSAFAPSIRVALLLVVPSGRLWQASGDARRCLGAVASAGPVLTRANRPKRVARWVPRLDSPRRDARPGHHVGVPAAAVVRGPRGASEAGSPRDAGSRRA